MATVIRAARLDGDPVLLTRGRGAARPAAAAAPPVGGTAQVGGLPGAGHAASTRNPGSVETTHAPLPQEAWPPAAMTGEAKLDLEQRDRLVREDFERRRQQALEQARAEGYRAGLEEGRAAFAAEVDALQSVIAAARQALSATIAGAEDVIVEIAVEALAKMLGAQLATREGVQAAVRQVIARVGEREPLSVRLAPEDFARLDQHRSVILKGLDGRGIEITADERVTLGGCLVETAGGTLDGRIETQLQRLRETLVEARKGAE